MSLLSICQWIQNTEIGTAIRESIFVFPIIETTHVLGLSLSVGLLVFSDLRLTGIALRRRPASEVYRQLAPWMLAGFAIMLLPEFFCSGHRPPRPTTASIFGSSSASWSWRRSMPATIT